MLYSFDVILKYDDYYEFNKFHMFNTAKGKKSLLFLRFYIPAILFIFLLFRTVSNFTFEIFLVDLSVNLIISVAWILVVKPLGIMILKLHLSAAKKKGTMIYDELSMVEFYDDYIRETTADRTTELKYSSIKEVYENEGKAVYIYQNAIMAYIIPVALFSSAEEKKEFIDFIIKKIQSNKENNQ